MSGCLALNSIIQVNKVSQGYKGEGKCRHEQDHSLHSLLTEWSECLKISLNKKELCHSI